jgi:hypothetical protein
VIPFLLPNVELFFSISENDRSVGRHGCQKETNEIYGLDYLAVIGVFYAQFPLNNGTSTSCREYRNFYDIDVWFLCGNFQAVGILNIHTNKLMEIK